ncbi:hypothetical protein PV08_11091 [Exophiala spinifera]|uniref:Uncharacterized protein n=1 Tax=Exophiala spinifera TaxID=91928 RepID=A0A0D1Y5C8_9EURO|nr:uncharacterized protein PV08_11091 [Exophiala spinifera]KIW10131.1 hypothetical protein PV08_11091 [Exophiala spinifera]
MADSPSSDDSSQGSVDEFTTTTTTTTTTQAVAKPPALKDKECPYCHQHFTSSSLGRHLDQFISKKKADGVHDVEEIRRLRGGITRRTARGSRKERDKKDRGETVSSSQASPGPSGIHSDAAAGQVSGSDLNRVPPSGIHIRLNRLNWQSTGVITDPTTLDSPVSVMPPTPAAGLASPSGGVKRSFSTYAQDLGSAGGSNNNADTTRALELALREVLDSLRAATKHASPTPSPFKFDVQSQTYPSLCLKMLPAPATLFQASPFATPQSIPIAPPGPDQLQPLRQKLTMAIDFWKWQALRLAQPTTSNIAEEADFLSRSAAQWSESTLNHLETCYQNWMVHPIEVRTLLWQVELLRSYNSEQQRVAELEEKLETLQQETNQLQQQVEYLSRCQWPREMALWPPERRTFGAAMREELRLMNLNKIPGAEEYSNNSIQLPESVYARGDKWDFDKLVNKWKTHLKEDKNRRIPASSHMSAVDSGAKQATTPTTTTGTTGTELKRAQTDPGKNPSASVTMNGLANGQSPNLNSTGTPTTAAADDHRRKGTMTSTSTTRSLPKGNVNINLVSDF